jgi:hypothetical protein
LASARVLTQTLLAPRGMLIPNFPSLFDSERMIARTDIAAGPTNRSPAPFISEKTV